MIMCLSLLLIACSSGKQIVKETEYVLPPNSFLAIHPRPITSGHTNEDILDHVYDLRELIEKYEVDKNLLQKWKDNHTPTQ